MRTLLRAGAIALAASSTLLGGAVAAQAAPAAAVTITVNRLILTPAEHGHTGRIRIAVRNNTSEPLSGNTIAITEPIRSTIETFDGADGCVYNYTSDDRAIAYCGLQGTVEPGDTAFVTIGFRSPAAPQPYAQVAPAVGSVEVEGVTAEFPALFRSTTGSLRHPRPYVQDTASALTVTAADVTLTRQEDGTFAGRVPVTVRSDGDAPHRALWTELAIPAGVDTWPSIEGGDVCVGAGDLPIPPDGFGIGCGLVGGQIAEGEQRSFAWLLTAPADTPAGELGTASSLVKLTDPGTAQADAANVDTFTITVA